MAYRLLVEKRVTWEDIEHRMSLDDVQLLCIAIDAWEDGRASGSTTT